MTDQKPKVMISIIAAIGPNRELGKDNKLLWHIPEDLRRFKKLTQGHAVIMGRKTYESLGKPLPNRLNIIISRNKNFLSLKYLSERNIRIFNSLEESVDFVRNRGSERGLEIDNSIDLNEVFIIGGGQIYIYTLPFADKLYLTLVEKTSDHPDGQFEADTFFPDYIKIFTKTVYEEKHEEGGNKYSFVELIR